MKFLNVFAAVFGYFLIPSGAVASSSSELLAIIESLEVEVYGFQASAQIQVQVLRQLAEEKRRDLFNQTFMCIQNNIKTIAASENELLTHLSQVNHTSCTNLWEKIFKEEWIELSGRDVSHCIGLQSAASINNTADIESLRLLETLEEEINYLGSTIIITAFDGGNVFTDGDAIVFRIHERLNTTKTGINSRLSQIKEPFDNFTAAWDDKIKEMQNCFNVIYGNIQQLVSFVRYGFRVCKKSEKLGARLAVDDPRALLV